MVTDIHSVRNWTIMEFVRESMGLPLPVRANSQNTITLSGVTAPPPAVRTFNHEMPKSLFRRHSDKFDLKFRIWAAVPPICVIMPGAHILRPGCFLTAWDSAWPGWVQHSNRSLMEASTIAYTD